MRFVSVRTERGVLPGLVENGEIVLLDEAFADLVALIEAGPDALAHVANLAQRIDASRMAFVGADLAPPITRHRRDVLCTGWNYWDHFEEGKAFRPTQPRPIAPTFFNRSPDSVIGPRDVIAIDVHMSPSWDYEAELALVFGTAGRSIAQADAFGHVFGYCLANDVSQRDLQRRHGGQWVKGKSIDGTMPLGPMLITSDEIDPGHVRIKTVLNGETMQDATTAQMAFAIPELIAELSYGMTLHPGDLLLTGTPAGVGQSRTPPVFLRDGDVLETHGTGVGELVNTVTQQDLRGASSIELG